MKIGDLVRVKPCMMPGPRVLERHGWMLKLGVILHINKGPTIRWTNGHINKVETKKIEVVNESW